MSTLHQDATFFTDTCYLLTFKRRKPCPFDVDGIDELEGISPDAAAQPPVRVSDKDIAVNEPQTLIFNVPALTLNETYRLVVKTQSSPRPRGGTFLKGLRIMQFNLELFAGPAI